MKKTAHLKSGVAACSFQLSAGAERIQLLPDGEFSAADGRPFDVPSRRWLMDQVAADMLLAGLRDRVNKIVIDYEHQTLLSEENGKPAPAAGWLKGTEFEYEPGAGLFARNPKWVGEAAGYIENEQYAYLSSVFDYDRKTGRPTRFRHAALVNDPALDGMVALAALKHTTTDDDTTQEETLMNELLKKLLAAIGIDITDADLADENKLKELVDQAVSQVGEQKTKATTAEGEVAALKASTGKVDLTQYVPIAVADELRGQVAALSANAGTAELDALISTARAEGRLIASEEKWARDLAEENGTAALKALIDKRPAVAALKGLQSKENPAKKPGEEGDALSAEDLAVCKNAGIDPADYRKNLSA